jgi:3-deoxy-D-manno-octulosonate 8-phosphate phosphatase (KDO 8-P phosphatase)
VKKLNEELIARLSRIRLVVTDVDGVLTDGRLYYADGGESHKAFHVRDGLGIRLLIENDIEVAVITARSGAAVAKRMSELDVSYVRQGRQDKRTTMTQLIKTVGCDTEQVLYVGDDVIDLPAMELAGLAVTVADGHDVVKEAADWVTDRAGGQGAFREVADAVLDASVGLPQAVERYLANR